MSHVIETPTIIRGSGLVLSVGEDTPPSVGGVATNAIAVFGDPTGDAPVEIRTKNEGLAIGRNSHSVLAAKSGTDAGQCNTAVGHKAQAKAVSVGKSTAYGYAAQENSVDGLLNTALGYVTQRNLVSGSQNTAVGHASQMEMTNGTYNTGVGASTMRKFTSGANNTAVGAGSLSSKVTVRRERERKHSYRTRRFGRHVREYG